MLKRLAIAALLILVYIQPLNPQAPRQPSAHPANTQTQQQPESPTLNGAMVNNQVTCDICKKEDSIAQQDSDKWVIRGFWVNAGLTVITLIIAIATLLQANAAKMQAKAQMDADRAWVLASVGGQPEEPLTGNAVKGIIPGIVWKIEIVGNTPAQILREQYRCRTVPLVNGAPGLEEMPTYLRNQNIIKEAEVFPPGHKYFMNFPLEPTPERMPVSTQMAEVIAGVRAFCAYGKIEYKDAFGRNGESQFCAIYRTRLGGIIKSPDGTDLNPPGFYIGGPKGYNHNT